jgi:hypothetical protein
MGRRARAHGCLFEEVTMLGGAAKEYFKEKVGRVGEWQTLQRGLEVGRCAGSRQLVMRLK